MSILHGLDHIISIGLFGSLAGLSLVALSIVAAILIVRHDSNEDTPKPINSYFGIAYFISSFAFFIFGLLLTLVLDSLGSKYYSSLTFEICSVVLTGIPLLSGIAFLLGGVNVLALATIKRGFRFFPRNCKPLIGILEMFFPTRKENQTITNKTKSTTDLPASELGLMKELADQLKTVFIAGLLLLWATTLESGPVERGSWVPWLIGSVFLFCWAFFYLRGKRISRPKLRWLAASAAAALLWLGYLLLGVSLPTGFLRLLAVVLLVWTILLFVTLLFVMSKKSIKGRLGDAIQRFTKWGGSFYWPLAVLVLLVSVLSAWARLWNSGTQDWWMRPILYFGIVVFIVVGIAIPISLNRNR